MKVSFKCLTHARVEFLEEAIYSFLLQQDNDAELVIVNDYPLQKLIFEHSQVKIFNLDTTFKTIGDKENFTIENCSGELIATADDDDVYMPWHLNNIKKYWKEGSNILHWIRGVYYNQPNITEITSVGNSGMVYSKKAWEAIGRSPIANAGGDTDLRVKIHLLDREGIIYAAPPDEEVSWFYRWALTDSYGNSCYHQSGGGTDHEGRPNIIQRYGDYIEALRVKGEIPIGEIKLKPRWRMNYKILLESYNKRNKKGTN